MDDAPRFGLRTSLFAGIVLVGLGFFAGSETKASQPPWVAHATTSGAITSGSVLEPLLTAWQILDENFAPGTTTEPLTKEDKLWGAISGLAASYGDPYTVFLPPQKKTEFESEVRGNFEGVGMEIAIKDGQLVVVAPLKNTPAERAGIQSGDFILAIDDKDTSGMAVEKAVSLIRGLGGTSVTLKMQREGKAPYDVSVVRETILLPTIDTKYLSDSGVFIISLYNFNAQVPELFRDAIREFSNTGSHKLIIDLRGNPGGYLEVAVDTASWFLPVGDAVVIEDYGIKQPEDVHRSRGYNVFGNKLQLAILIDDGSASAAEILAGALHDHGKATLIGQKSFGKGSVQQLFEVTNDSSLKITIARWLTPNRVSISQEGISPDIKVDRTQEDRTNKKDPQLDRAVEYLKGLGD